MSRHMAWYGMVWYAMVWYGVIWAHLLCEQLIDCKLGRLKRQQLLQSRHYQCSFVFRGSWPGGRGGSNCPWWSNYYRHALQDLHRGHRLLSLANAGNCTQSVWEINAMQGAAQQFVQLQHLTPSSRDSNCNKHVFPVSFEAHSTAQHDSKKQLPEYAAYAQALYEPNQDLLLTSMCVMNEGFATHLVHCKRCIGVCCCISFLHSRQGPGLPVAAAHTVSLVQSEMQQLLTQACSTSLHGLNSLPDT